jgi:hypothetical protein
MTLSLPASAAKEGRDLQHVDHIGDGSAMFRRMHVGQHRQTQRLLDLGKDRQGGLQADAARAGARGAVRLVEGALVDQPDAELFRDLFQRLTHFQRMFATFHGAGAREQDEGKVVADGKTANFHMMNSCHCPRLRQTSRACSIAARMKEANSGCGWKGFDFSSG